MIGLQRSTVSPCSSSMSRSTPCVLGCCGPMLMIIVWSSSGSLAGGRRARPPRPRSCAARRRPRAAARPRRQLAARLAAPGRPRTVWRDQSTVIVASPSLTSRSLNCTGMRADLVVLAQRVALPVLGHEDAREVGVVGERDAEHVEHLALHRLGAGVQVEQRRQRRRRRRAPARGRGCAGAAAMSSRLTTTSKRSGATPSGSGRPGWVEVVDGREVDAHRVAVVGQRLDSVEVPLARRRGARPGRGSSVRGQP